MWILGLKGLTRNGNKSFFEDAYEVAITCLETLTHIWFLSPKMIQMIIIA